MLMKIYNLSPIFMQNIYTSLVGLKNKKERYGKHYKIALHFYRNFNDESTEFVQSFQKEELKKLIDYAIKHSEFYSEFYQKIDIDQIKEKEDIKNLPILTKELVRRKVESMYTINEEEAFISNTSGTTGKSLKFRHTKEGIQYRMAYLDYFKEKHGFTNIKMKRASFNSSRIVPSNQKKNIYWRDNYLLKQRIYSGYHCQGNNIKYYIKNLNSYKPKSLDGYPSAIYEIARYILENNIQLEFQPIAIFPTAETLLPIYREVIEKAFNCKIYDQYAASEGTPFITECIYGKLHYNQCTGIIEFDENNEMLMTSFFTYGTPLIRYKIGDRAILEENQTRCNCGSTDPIVKEIIGRSSDYLLTKSKGKIPAAYLSLVSEEFKNSIIKMQFVQNSLDEIKINIVADKTYEDSMDKIILEKLNQTLGKDMNFKINKVKEITKDTSGKFRYILNDLHM